MVETQRCTEPNRVRRALWPVKVLDVQTSLERSYRSPKQSHLGAPARILWYVSQGHAKRGAKSIKACSRLDSIEVGDAEEIYRRYRRLGVYTRRNVLDAVKGRPSRDLMA